MSGSVTQWLGSMMSGDEDAISCLWARYYDRMRACARRAVNGCDVGGVDDEDIATIAFTQFADRALTGQFPELINRNQLWRLLSVITSRTAYGKLTRQYAMKRGGGNAARATDQIESHGCGKATPQSILSANDDLERLLRSLQSEDLKEVAILSLQGHSTREISHLVGSTQRTVQRMLVIIRDCWVAEAGRLGVVIPD